MDLSRICRYLDKLGDNQHNIVQEISVKHILGARMKNESEEIKRWILRQPKTDRQIAAYKKSDNRKASDRLYG